MGFWENRRLRKIADARTTIIEGQESLRKMEQWKEEIVEFNTKDPLEQVDIALKKVGLLYTGRDLIGKKCLVSYIEFHYRQVHLSTIVGVDATYKEVTLRLASPVNQYSDCTNILLHDEKGWYTIYWTPQILGGRGENVRLDFTDLRILVD